ncbi:lamin tail domain-containing protein [Agromyces mangrovi Wang et al. 2018]|uniref:lamin tail domain-containing protein n=1 Tax=Agromyces mangrovi TaxID=1858653 RepID=UPI002573728C|nr:lamin tail domain-containing protein [Agromyces mangrovi]BDZ63298.1 hypothetical protein GCM10025877_02360 [Agromyces mangrovi]
MDRRPRLAPATAFVAAVVAILAIGAVLPGSRSDASQATPGVERLAGAVAEVTGVGPIVIDELADGGPGSHRASFVELRNISGAVVDLRGWRVYRCDPEGLRPRLDDVDAVLDGVSLAPGERLTIATAEVTVVDGGRFDLRLADDFREGGFGVLVQDDAGVVVDAVGVYPDTPWATHSECTRGANLPDTLAFALGESWQRVGTTGDVRVDFARVRATPGGPATGEVREPDASPTGIRITEIAPSGPASDGDEFVELANLGETPVSLDGWTLYRCTAWGRVGEDTLEARFGAERELAPGERLLVAGSGYRSRAGEAVPDVVAAGALGQAVTGALLVDPTGARVDGVTVSGRADTGCQTGGEKLPAADLDARSGESWQRVAADGGSEASFVLAPRTPGHANATEERSVVRAAAAESTVVISELATDPAQLPDGATQRNWIELANYGDAPVDLSGWRVVRCGADGFRERRTLALAAPGTVLEPGGTWLAALVGTEAATRSDAVYRTGFDFQGTGAWVEDAAGNRVDRVGVWLANEMDHPDERPSACTDGESLTTFAPDRLRGETYRRVAFTGVDADDFATGAATPGRIDLPAPETTESAAVASPSTPVAGRSAEPAAAADDGDDGFVEVGLVDARVGAGQDPLTVRGSAGERGGLVASADGYDRPYARLTVEVDAQAAAEGRDLRWVGSGTPGDVLALSAWRHDAERWEELDRVDVDGDGTDVRLAGRVEPVHVRDDAVELLVGSVPRDGTRLARTSGEGLAERDEYDLAISHLTDTQYLSEAYPDVYVEATEWIADSADALGIAFALHTGDLVQNWIDPGQAETRARREYERASAAQAVLEAAGVPTSVLPGNHDNKRATTDALFNEYFGPERYDGDGVRRGTIAPDDNSANFAAFTASGARFLVLNLPYGYGEADVAWAETVIGDHPRHNVILATHEHLRPKEADASPRRSTDSRWLSQADDLWQRLVEPHRNVVLVLSGHFHGIGTQVTHDVGEPGHTVVEMIADYQEFRTHTGSRATGFQRLLQFDLASGAIAVDTFSATLGAGSSHPFDYPHFVVDDGDPATLANDRPWNIVAPGAVDRYAAEDDAFVVEGLEFQVARTISTDRVLVAEAQSAAVTDPVTSAHVATYGWSPK